MSEKVCCGTCKYNHSVWIDEDNPDFCCGNSDCANFGIPTSYDDYCGEWEGKDSLEKAQEAKLRTLHDKGCTDSDIIEFCEDNNINQREAFHLIAIWNAPECCQGCKHIDLYPSMPPCSSCSRRCTDNYEKA